MKNFTLSEENLVNEFLDELDICYEDIFEQELKIIFPELTKEKQMAIFESLFDEISEEVLTIFWDIKCYAYDEFEVSEGSGLWGYYVFEITDVSETVQFFENLLSEKMRKLIFKLIKSKKLKIK